MVEEAKDLHAVSHIIGWDDAMWCNSITYPLLVIKCDTAEPKVQCHSLSIYGEAAWQKGMQQHLHPENISWALDVIIYSDKGMTDSLLDLMDCSGDRVQFYSPPVHLEWDLIKY